MKKFLRLLAALVLLSAGTTWILTGASPGWSKTQVPHQITDPVTGIQYDSWEKKFVAGVDFLGAAAIIALGLAGASLLFRDKKTTNQLNNQPPLN